MSGKIKILILEDNDNDVELLKHLLHKSELLFMLEVVSTRKTFESRLNTFSPDIILSDYSLPCFDGETAFHITRKKYPYVPFIIVSGTIGDEKAVELIKMGITDYVLKKHSSLIVPKIIRALKEADEYVKKW